MKYFLVILFGVVSACSYLGSAVSGSDDDPVIVKQRVMNLVKVQREKKEWMKTEGCPADQVPETTRRPKLTSANCASDPLKCLSSCENNDGDSCYGLARLIQDHDGIENDVADVLFRHSCRLGITSGCTNSASKLFESNEREALSCAARTFEIACAKDDPWGCAMSGLAQAEGIGRDKDVAAARRSLSRACDISVDKNGEACKRAKELLALIGKE